MKSLFPLRLLYPPLACLAWKGSGTLFGRENQTLTAPISDILINTVVQNISWLNNILPEFFTADDKLSGVFVWGAKVKIHEEDEEHSSWTSKYEEKEPKC